ncbi:hypothetical protein BIY24_00880 [Halobacteriovorax marinus]|uniref:hypothetical protein n=1 Tax=Halobacteriovorax marinus TaxID=97084 RepID=UPI000BC2D230|nr:hypothetical protein [Halobacteriovorax marinus]ATH06545.1 hypothetical protein BIY24_00880 [Halobacteriovorax marinus]
MAVKKLKKNILRNEEGQAIFEFVLFLPFIIFLYTVLINITNSINGSINQQKATRGYFYRLVKHDSRTPNRVDIEFLLGSGINVMGASSVGWRRKSVGDTQSFGTCYKFMNFFGNETDEECDESRVGEVTSNFIKLFTFYGVCGETYMKSTSGYVEGTNFLRYGSFADQLGYDQCVQK